jgi:hypothetical protein
MPTAEITRSTVISWVLPPCSTVTVTLSAPFLTPFTVALVSSFMPCFSNAFCAKALISSSSTGRTRSITSTTVTAAPMFRKKLANSMPMAPDPITSSDFGIIGGTIASL